ncbi:MAG: type I-B CRISPR-associated protein Cas5b [Candidatus Nitrosopolaris sp.]
MPKLVCFDVASPFGCFRKGFTTTNALTYGVIPRSAVEGLTASILGLSRTDFPDLLKDSKIAVKIASPVRKLNMKYMHINPKWWNETLSHYINNTQFVLQETREQIAVPASVEVLVDPAYGIYIDINEKINDELSRTLMNRQSYYTPYLGTSSLIASAKYSGEFEYDYSANKDYVPVSSIIPFSGRIPKIKLEKGSNFAIEEDITIHVDNERRPKGTYSVVYAIEPGQIMVIDKDIIEIKEKEKIVYVKFLPTKVTS